MRDIWNPWHGCKRISEGCENCYMYYLDSLRGKDGAEIYKVKNNFDYPLHKDRNGNYKIKSGEYIRVCMTSDFFLKEADCWREEVWKIIKKRSDVIFILVTKRADKLKTSGLEVKTTEARNRSSLNGLNYCLMSAKQQIPLSHFLKPEMFS